METLAPPAPHAPPVRGTPVERILVHAGGWMDEAIARLVAGQAWFLWVGAVAVVLSLLVHTPAPTVYNRFAASWTGQVLATQIARPLTPLDLSEAGRSRSPVRVREAIHLEKRAFRLTLPILGNLLRTGKATWLIFSWLSGLAFFPLLAWAAARWTADRRTAAYLTLACATTYAGCFFFQDVFCGDGLAWLLLLVAVAVARPAAVFAAVLAAAFIDERAFLASAGVLLFWCLDPVPGDDGTARPWMAVLLAGAAYLGVRLFLGAACGLAIGHHQMFSVETFGEHTLASLPYKALSVLKGLWVWLPLGLLGLVAGGRWKTAASYAGIGAGLVVTSLAVYDLDRSLGYLLVLLPVAFRVGGLSPANNLRLARVTFLFSLALITPWYTPLRYVFLLDGVRVDQIPLP